MEMTDKAKLLALMEAEFDPVEQFISHWSPLIPEKDANAFRAQVQRLITNQFDSREKYLLEESLRYVEKFEASLAVLRAKVAVTLQKMLKEGEPFQGFGPGTLAPTRYEPK